MLIELVRRCHRDEEGSTLILVLILVSVLAIGAAALLSFTDTSVKTSEAVQTQGNNSYAADGAVQAAISAIRETSQGTVSAGCPTVTSTLNGATYAVTCTPMPGSGTVGDGGQGTTPPAAVITLGTNAANLENDFELINPNSTVTITGISSAQNITVDNQTTLNISPTTATAASVLAGSSGPPHCNLVGSGVIQPASTAKCGTLTSVADPAYTLPSYASVITQTVTNLGTGCDNKLNVLQPGEYNDTLTWQQSGGTVLTGESALNGYLNCTGNGGNSGTIFWFQPGFFYFNFSTDTSPVSLAAKNNVYVAGNPQGWTPAPNVNVNTVQGLAQNGKSCVSSGTSSSAVGSIFVFGRDSRLGISSGTFELCPWFDVANTATAPRISMYGVPRTTGGWTAQAGCSLGPGLCSGGVIAWFNPAGSGGTGDPEFLTVWGTVYAPKASIFINLPSQAGQPLFDRGVVSRIFQVNKTAANGLANSIGCGPLGCGAGPAQPRQVLLQAYNVATGKLALQAVVSFNDNNQQTWGQQVTVTAWSVIR